MIRTTACLLAILASGQILAQSRDEPPAPVRGLEASVYSGTAAGLKWQRASDDRGVRGYQIYREGALLGEVDALSFIVRDLVPGALNNFSVVSVDTAGQRSNASTGIAFSTPGGANDVPPPTTPTLRAAVYSATAAGLAWTRPPTGGGPSERVQQYELRRDGALVRTTRDASYIDTTLAGGRSYRYELVAIGTSGARSAPARVTVETPGGGTPTSPPGGLAAVSGLRSSVYSATAAGIAWTRSAAPVTRYAVSRDGTPLTSTDGTSYVDTSLAGGRSYTYEVVAIDREGRRSTASVITLATSGGAPVGPSPGDGPFAEPDPEGASVVARLGYPAARDLADDLVSSGYLSLYYDIDAALIDFLTSFPQEQSVFTATCPGGGTARGSMGYYFFLDVELDGCTIEGRTLSGHLVHESEFIDPPALSSNRNATVTFDDLSIDAGAAGRLLVSGTSARREASYLGSAGCEPAPTFVREIDNRIETARVENADGVSNVTAASWTQTVQTDPLLTGRPFRDPCLVSVTTLAFAGEASVASPRFGTGGATLEKRGDIVRDPREDGASEASARLAADFGDGSTLTITATSDADGEAQVDIVADGVAVSFTDAYRFEAREDLPTIGE